MYKLKTYIVVPIVSLEFFSQERTRVLSRMIRTKKLGLDWLTHNAIASCHVVNLNTDRSRKDQNPFLRYIKDTYILRHSKPLDNELPLDKILVNR